MKFSISVPDELWEFARTVITGDSPSGVVQEALRRLRAEDAAEPSYAQAPAMGDELGAVLAATRERLRGEARSLYQDGYRHGVKLVGQLTWSQLSWIVGMRGVVAAAKAAKQCQFDVMAGRLPDGARPVIEPDILADYVGRHADEGLDWAPSSVILEGMDRALQDVWDHVHSPDGAVAPQPKQ